MSEMRLILDPNAPLGPPMGIVSDVPIVAKRCDDCGAEYVTSAEVCPACGSDRANLPAPGE